jgi:hypothetical protein
MSYKKDLIQDLVSKRRYYYSKLTQDEKMQLVSTIIKESDYSSKSALLVDADDDTKLPDLVADVIGSNGSIHSAAALVKEILNIFVHGTERRDAYFAESIDSLLEDELIEQSRGLEYIDDMPRQDAYERARDMQKAVA